MLLNGRGAKHKPECVYSVEIIHLYNRRPTTKRVFTWSIGTLYRNLRIETFLKAKLLWNTIKYVMVCVQSRLILPACIFKKRSE